jgi:hypothetical protein
MEWVRIAGCRFYRTNCAISLTKKVNTQKFTQKQPALSCLVIAKEALPTAAIHVKFELDCFVTSAARDDKSGKRTV